MPFFFIMAAVLLRIAPHVSALQFIPHLPNFTPIAAMALFSGVYLNRRYALIVPLLAMFCSDIFIGFYNPLVMISVYGSFLLIGLFGLWVRKHKTATNIASATLGGSLMFFLVTNFAVWAFPGSFSMYPGTWQGLMQSYIMGLPFFRNELLGDVFYVTAMFGLYETYLYYFRRRAVCPVKSKN